MSFMMRSAVSLALALMIALYGASCVEGGTTEDWIMARTGVDIGPLILIQSTDTHGGFLFDGGSLDVFECDRAEFEAIEGDWRPLPLSDNLRDAVYGAYRDPQVGVPRIKNGKYMFFDRHAEATDPSDDGMLLTRASVNMSLFIYDTVAARLYYYEYDT